MNWTLLEDFFCKHKQHLAALALQQAAAAAALASDFKHETLGIGGTLLSLGGIIIIVSLLLVECQLVVHVVVVPVVVVVVLNPLN